MSRRKGRIIAVQALYSWDVGKVSMEDLLQFTWLKALNNQTVEESDEIEEAQGSEAESDASKDFARILITGTIENINQIDGLIKAHLSANWTIERMNKVSLAILRMSIFSFLKLEDTHHSIVIDEAIEIAKDFAQDDQYRFINGILDKISKELSA